MLFSAITILNEHFDIEKNVDVRIKDGKIATISKTPLEVETGERVISGAGKLLMPGLANLHCHVPMTLLRGRGEGLDLWSWLSTAIFPFEAQLTEDDIKVGTRLGLLEMIASGVTTFTEMYFEIAGIIDVLEASKIRANVCHGVNASPEPFAERKGIIDTLQMVKRLGDNRGRVRVDMGLHAEYTSDEVTVRGIADIAREHDLIVHVHISETANEHRQCIERHNMTPIAWMQHCGVLDSPVIAAHCVHVSDDDLATMAGAKVTPVHCISSNLKLGSGVARLGDWEKAGITYAIGTDGAASNNNLNFFEEMHLVSLVHKGVSGDPTFLQPKALLKAATRAGYLAQRRPDGGLIKEGFAADLAVIDLDRPHLLPENDLASHLVHSAQATDVYMTIVGGDVLYENGEFKTIDAERAMADAKRVTAAILARM